MHWSILVFWLLVAVFVHELGHYVAYRLYGYKPGVVFKWHGAIVMGGGVYKKIPLYKYFVINLAGVFAGLFVVAWLPPFALFIYLVMSMVDFKNMFIIIREYARGEDIVFHTSASLERKKSINKDWNDYFSRKKIR